MRSAKAPQTPEMSLSNRLESLTMRTSMSGDGRGMRTLSTNSPGREILLAVAQEEILERDGAALRSAAERELGAERDQGGRHVADRRAVGDIAADRAGVADLDAADPPDQLAEIGVQAGQRLAGVGIADGGAERERVRALLDPPQIGDVADEDGRAEVAKLLGDPQADVGRAGDDAGLGMREEEIGEFVGRCAGWP